MFEVHSLQGYDTSQSEAMSSNPYYLYWYVFPSALMVVTPTYHLSGTNLHNALYHSSLSYMCETWSFYWRCFAHVLMTMMMMMIMMTMMMMTTMVITRSLKIRYKTPKASTKQKLTASLLLHVSFIPAWCNRHDKTDRVLQVMSIWTRKVVAFFLLGPKINKEIISNLFIFATVLHWSIKC